MGRGEREEMRAESREQRAESREQRTGQDRTGQDRRGEEGRGKEMRGEERRGEERNLVLNSRAGQLHGSGNAFLFPPPGCSRGTLGLVRTLDMRGRGGRGGGGGGQRWWDPEWRRAKLQEMRESSDRNVPDLDEATVRRQLNALQGGQGKEIVFDEISRGSVDLVHQVSQELQLYSKTYGKGRNT
eukprot:623324-Hanusia_phi.AAC.2